MTAKVSTYPGSTSADRGATQSMATELHLQKWIAFGEGLKEDINKSDDLQF